MWSPAVSPWFASLLLAYSFPPGTYTDLEVARDGTVWILMEGRPELYAVPRGGEPTRYFLDDLSRPSGLALDGAGGVLVSDASRNTITAYDRFIRRVSSLDVSGSPGDLALSGMSIWYIDIDRRVVLSTTGVVLARDAPASGSLSHHRGTGLLAGDGVRRITEGMEPVTLSTTGTGCLAGDRVLVLRDSVLFQIPGDTLLTSVAHTRVASSPGGGTVVLWGGGRMPVVLE
jgi:hypothetical protein